MESIDDDGTVHFAAAAREAVADLVPDLAEPLPVADLEQRARHLDALLA